MASQAVLLARVVGSGPLLVGSGWWLVSIAAQQ